MFEMILLYTTGKAVVDFVGIFVWIFILYVLDSINHDREVDKI